ncbi:DUF6069 family protein [Sphaerisporangium perillae]|uniref:DUF6069 family protein n=1 Tax=Sphaerisporangium perillae TaxID=2935860 RepID=UPI0020109FC5|nr:DUF6069 family protein [Sphaerisporangium perillae]
MQPTTATTTPAETAGGSRRAIRALAVAGAAVAGLAVWAVADPVAGVDLAVRLNGTAGAVDRVGPAAVVITSVLAGLAGWALLALLERLTRRGTSTWTVVALVVLVLSLAGPLASGVTAAAKIALLCMHLAVGAVLIGVLPAARRRADGRAASAFSG